MLKGKLRMRSQRANSGTNGAEFGRLTNDEKENKLRKMMMLAALLAMMIVTAIPAIAQVEQDFDQDTESGEVEQSFEISSEGNNGNQCVNVNGTTNTGNLQTQTGSIQYASDTEESEQEEIGSDLTVEGDSTTDCTQEVNQAAAAG